MVCEAMYWLSSGLANKTQNVHRYKKIINNLPKEKLHVLSVT